MVVHHQLWSQNEELSHNIQSRKITIIEQNLLPIALLALSIAGTLLFFHSIPLSDLLFCIFYPFYIYVANTICFNSNELVLKNLKKDEAPPSLGKGLFLNEPAFVKYIQMAQVVGVLFPILHILWLSKSYPSLCQPVVATTVLLFVQVAMETLTSKFHDIPRFLVPVGFNIFRMKSLLEWVSVSYYHITDEPSNTLLYVGFVLAIANTIIWAYTAFVFLLLRVLPEYFDKKDTPPIEFAYTLVPIPKGSNGAKSEESKSQLKKVDKHTK